MHYITLWIFIKEGKKEVFERYESKVIPLLENHHGKLIYRMQVTQSMMINDVEEIPDELHFLSFRTKADFEAYKADPMREYFAYLLTDSVAKVIMVEGEMN